MGKLMRKKVNKCIVNQKCNVKGNVRLNEFKTSLPIICFLKKYLLRAKVYRFNNFHI